MKILTTGSKGQLGLSIKKLSKRYSGYEFIFTDIEELDILKPGDVEKFVSKTSPDVIINCAAYTAVDRAEQEPDKAYELNTKAPSTLAKISKRKNILLIHISTDFIFDGSQKKPYSEDNTPNPLSVYARTKAEGEKEVINNASNAVIIRTSWLYSEFGHNFVKTILKLANEKPEINVVSDQIGTPTYASDLADFILKLLPAFHKSKLCTDILHFSNEGETSWYGFAKEIVRLAGLDCKVNPIPTSQYPLPAKRPAYSVLDKTKIITKYGMQVINWKESLKKCIDICKTMH